MTVPSKTEIENIAQSLRDLVRYGGNCDHQDRKNLLGRAAADLEALSTYAEGLKELVPLARAIAKYLTAPERVDWPGDEEAWNTRAAFLQVLDKITLAQSPSQVSKSADHASATGASGVEASAKGPLTPSFTEGEGRTRDEAIRRWSAKVAWLEECAGKLAVLGLQTANADLVEYASGLTVTFPEGAPRVKAPDFENLEGSK